MAPAPHFLLVLDRTRQVDQGEWKFTLRATDGTTCLEANDREPNASGERLELLTVVRGLEALDQPSRVTLVAASPFLANGLRYGLDEWRDSDWTWERFGERVAVKNRDLWQRLDRALQFHRVECAHVERRRFRLDPAHGSSRAAPSESLPALETTAEAAQPRGVGRSWRFRAWIRIRRSVRNRWEYLQLRFAQWGTPLTQPAWLS